MENMCHWCTPYDDDTYDMSQFVNPKNENICLKIGLIPYESKLGISLDLPDSEGGYIHQEINFCPMCGRKLRRMDDENKDH